MGFYTGADKIARGFLMRDGVFTTIEIPGLIQLRGISPSGVIVGSFIDDGVTRGFILHR